ncbi:Hypothetical predicted protein [Olea europaea subsp. europaea]|uniref:Uncharacterized protein n=1 Tax=Olea europaea subsp. europaea TaxID=158383 RepID=A0A8S0TYM9_OLEEU|nr:Hypothetical predicted protein [Olea europaea subsp. europaea]
MKVNSPQFRQTQNLNSPLEKKTDSNPNHATAGIPTTLTKVPAKYTTTREEENEVRRPTTLTKAPTNTRLLRLELNPRHTENRTPPHGSALKKKMSGDNT